MNKAKKLYMFADDASLDGNHVLALSEEQLAVFYWFMDLGYDFSLVPLCEEKVEEIDTDKILKKWECK